MEQAKGPLPEGVVTFLLTDIEGSTRLWDTDPEAMAVALATHEHVIAEIVDGAGGWLLRERGEGDSTLSVFAARDRRGHRGARCATPTAWRDLASSAHAPDAHRSPHRRTPHAQWRVLRRNTEPRRAHSWTRHWWRDHVLTATHDLVIDAVPAGAHIDYLGEHELRGLRRRESVYAIWQPDVTAPVSRGSHRHPNRTCA